MIVNSTSLPINLSGLNSSKINEKSAIENSKEISIEENYLDPLEGYFNKQNILFKLLAFHGVIDHEGKLIRSLNATENTQPSPLNIFFDAQESPFLCQLLWTNKKIIHSDSLNTTESHWSIGNILMKINHQVFKNQIYQNKDLLDNVYPSNGHILLDQENSFWTLFKDGFLESLLDSIYQTANPAAIHNIEQLLKIYQIDSGFNQTQPSSASISIICHPNLHESIKALLIHSFEEAFPNEKFNQHANEKLIDQITKLKFCFANGNVCFILKPVQSQLTHEYLFLTLVNNQGHLNAFIKNLHEKPEQFVLNLLCDQINVNDGFNQIHSLIDLFYNTRLNIPPVLEKSLANSLMKKINLTESLNLHQTKLKLKLLNFSRLFNFKINGTIDSTVLLLDLILQKLEKESVLFFQKKQENVQIPRFLFRLFQSLQKHEHLDDQSIDLIYQFLNSLGWIYNHYSSDLFIDILMKSLLNYQIPFKVLSSWIEFLCLQNARSCQIGINNESNYIIFGSFQIKISNEPEAAFQALEEYFKDFSHNDFHPFYWLHEHFSYSFYRVPQPNLDLSCIEKSCLEKFAHTLLRHNQEVVSTLGIEINLWFIKLQLNNYIKDAILFNDEFLNLLKIIRSITEKIHENQLVYPHANIQIVSILNAIFTEINLNRVKSVSNKDLYSLLLNNTELVQLLDFSVALKHIYQNHLLAFCKDKFNDEQRSTLLLKCILSGQLDFNNIPKEYLKLIRPSLSESHSFRNQDMKIRWNDFKMHFWRSHENLQPWEALIQSINDYLENNQTIMNQAEAIEDAFFISFEKLNLNDSTLTKNSFHRIIQSLVSLFINLYQQKTASSNELNRDSAKNLDSRLKTNISLLIQPFIYFKKSDDLLFLLREINKHQHIQLNYLKKDYLYPFLEQYFIVNKNIEFKIELLKKIIDSELRFHFINHPMISISKENLYAFSEIDFKIPIFLLHFFKKITENAPYFNNEKFKDIKLYYNILLVCSNFNVLDFSKDIKNIHSFQVSKTLFQASKYLLEIGNKSTTILGLETFIYPFILILNLYSATSFFNSTQKKQHDEINNHISEITKILAIRMDEMAGETLEMTIRDKNKKIKVSLFEDFSIFLMSLLKMIISNPKKVTETTILQFLDNILNSIQKRNSSHGNNNHLLFELLEIEISTLKNFINCEIKPTNHQMKFINNGTDFAFEIQTIEGLKFIIEQYNKIDPKNHTLKTFKNDPILRRRFQLIFEKLNFILIVLLNKVIIINFNVLSITPSNTETPLQKVVKHINENIKSFFKIYAFKAILKELKKTNLDLMNQEIDFINKLIENILADE